MKTRLAPITLKHGNLRHCTKPGLVGCLKSTTPDQVVHDCEPSCGAEVLDGAVIVHMLPPKVVRTNFNEYTVNTFAEYQ